VVRTLGGIMTRDRRHASSFGGLLPYRSPEFSRKARTYGVPALSEPQW